MAFLLKIPRTIDRLQMIDCVEIIVNDLGRYGVSEKLAMTPVEECFVPMKKTAEEYKERYGDMCTKDTPESSFE